jgi:predicted lipoprotein with Yx(FWY)xxD motif
MQHKILLVLAAAGALLAACGSNSSTPTAAPTSSAPAPITYPTTSTAAPAAPTSTAPAAPTSTAPAAPAAPAPSSPAPTAAILAKSATSSLGTIVVDGAGRTLYGFSQDAMGTSTCNNGCAQVWPPVVVKSPLEVSGLNKSLFSTVKRADGSEQLKMGSWPLYYFAGDAGPGDANGQGTNGFFTIGVNGKLIKS